MKFIKLYENFDEWDEDDFDFEEELPIRDFKIGDIVDVKKSILIHSSRKKDIKSEYYKGGNYLNNAERTMELEIIDIGYNSDGIKVIKLDNFWPWYYANEFKLIR